MSGRAWFIRYCFSTSLPSTAAPWHPNDFPNVTRRANTLCCSCMPMHQPPTLLSENTHGMRLVHYEGRIVAFAHFYHGKQIAGIAIHAVDALYRHDGLTG
jgi:hypothetical protein